MVVDDGERIVLAVGFRLHFFKNIRYAPFSFKHIEGHDQTVFSPVGDFVDDADGMGGIRVRVADCPHAGFLGDHEEARGFA